MRKKMLLAFGLLAAAGAIIGTASLTGLSSPGGLSSLAAQEVVEEDHAVLTLGDGGGYLGVYLEDVDAEAADRLGLPEEAGARVEDVVDDSPAAEAGLQKNDVIVRYNGETVESVAELSRLVRETPAGRTVTLDVIRDGRTRQISVELGERPGRIWVGPEGEGNFEFRVAPGEGPHVFEFGGFGRGGRLGVQLQSLSEQLGEYFGVSDGDGALITSVREESPAAAAGLRAGDVITRVGDADVDGPTDVARAIRKADAGSLPITIVRDGSARTVTVDLPERRSQTGKIESEDGVYSFVLPDIGIPGIIVPEIRTPSVLIPEIRIPSFSIDGNGKPWVVVPEITIPEIDIREMVIPEIRVPGLEIPGREITIAASRRIV
jgi:membrane-associated protease RseP (regulator of RpoE activity)